METPKEYYYTYYSYEEWGKGYIGSRKCKCLPKEDIKYFGSSKDKTFKPTHKIIIKDDYYTREEAYADEIILQQYYKVVENPHFANKSYQTSTKFYVPTEQARENGRKSIKKQRELGTGLYSFTPEERSENAKKYSGIGGKRAYELGVGIHSLTAEEKREAGKKGGKIIGAINAKKCYETKTGIHGRTKEKRIEDARKGGLIGGSMGAKKTNSQKWMCEETGHISNPGALAKYQRARGIDTFKRRRVE